MDFYEALYYLTKITEEADIDIIPPMKENQNFFRVENDKDWGEDGNT